MTYPIRKRFFAALGLLGAISLPHTSAAASFPNDVVLRGQYLATASDCIACHTAAGGKPMAGGLSIASPVGEIISSNITPSRQYGIGNYTEQQFADALRKGVRADGANLYPAMPYTAYAVLTDQDVHALYAYFMQGVKPVDQPTKPTSLPFPMNIRLSMSVWNKLFLTQKPFTPNPQQSDEWNRGRYLVDGAAHCSTCHTPRGFLMQENLDQQFAGAQVGPWFAPNITPDKISGIGSWTQAELVTYLKTGRLPGKAQAAGSMAEAISHSFRYLSDADLHAMAVYMQSVPALATTPATGSLTSRFDQGKPGNALPDFRGVKLTGDEPQNVLGAKVFSANCASCHGYNGQGSKDGYYPSLFHNSATAGINANNLMATILFGVDRTTESGHVFMPPFGKATNAVTSLSNDDIAALTHYLLAAYGNKQVKVSANDVEVIRQGGPQSYLLLLARAGMAFGILCVALLAYIVIKRRQGK